MSDSGRSPREMTWSHPAAALLLLLRGRTARVALPVTVVVGTVLSSVNQGAIVFSGEATTSTWIRVGANYLVPFLVSSYGYLTARRVPSAPVADNVDTSSRHAWP